MCNMPRRDVQPTSREAVIPIDESKELRFFCRLVLIRKYADFPFPNFNIISHIADLRSISLLQTIRDIPKDPLK